MGSPPRSCAWLAGLVLGLAGCGGHGSESKPAPAGRPASSSLGAHPPALGTGLSFRRRGVDTLLTPTAFRARVSDSPLPVPRGRRAVRIAVRWQDSGREPFPFEWARFALADRAGRTCPESARTPVRRLTPRERRSAKATILAFVVPRGFRPARLRVSSVVAVWRFRARWRIPHDAR